MDTKQIEVPLGVVLLGDAKAGSVKLFITNRTLYHVFPSSGSLQMQKTSTSSVFVFESSLLSLL